MRIGFDRANFALLADLWNRVAPSQYALSAEQLRLCTTDSLLFDWGASIIEVEDGRPTAMIAIKKPATNLFPGPDPDAYHITALAFESPIQALDLMAYVKRLLANRGAYLLRFGQDHQHIWPGCPSEWQSLRDFLTVEGFAEGPEQFDVESNIHHYSAVEHLAPLAPDGNLQFEVRPAAREDLPALYVFLDSEFPGRWRYDVERKVEREGDPGAIHILSALGSADVLGFSMTQREGCRWPIAGAVWNQSLGSNWGTLGPIGVAKSTRGKGLGGALLAASLDILRRQGTQQCLIDWTTLVDFYGKHGFTPTRRYISMALRLD